MCEFPLFSERDQLPQPWFVTLVEVVDGLLLAQHFKILFAVDDRDAVHRRLCGLRSERIVVASERGEFEHVAGFQPPLIHRQAEFVARHTVLARPQRRAPSAGISREPFKPRNSKISLMPKSSISVSMMTKAARCRVSRNFSGAGSRIATRGG